MVGAREVMISFEALEKAFGFEHPIRSIEVNHGRRTITVVRDSVVNQTIEGSVCVQDEPIIAADVTGRGVRR